MNPAWLVAALCLAGCSDVHAEDCNRLVSVANAQEDRVDAQLRAMSATQEPEQLVALAAVIERAGNAVGAVVLRDARLRVASGEYRAVLTETTAVVRAMADAQRAGDGGRYGEGAARLRALDARGGERVRAINGYCAGR